MPHDGVSVSSKRRLHNRVDTAHSWFAMRTRDYSYSLPPELIAQSPLDERDGSRLMVVRRGSRIREHRRFKDLVELLPENALLILNNSKVIPARLRAVNPLTGGAFEILLLEQNGVNDWWAMLRPGKRAPVGRELVLLGSDATQSRIRVVITEVNAEGHRRLCAEGCDDLASQLDSLGEMPLPPYIERGTGNRCELDRARYQTVYAEAQGSVAAPTAGLHFSPEVLMSIRDRGIEVQTVTLHVGAGTFAPVKVARLEDHRMHGENYELSEKTAEAINRARSEKRAIIAAGTTSLRVLESAPRSPQGFLRAGKSRTHLFLYPPSRFAVVDGLITNFHLPESTLLMLVSAFVSPGELEGREIMLDAYAEAVREGYRFFSYGDAMFIL